MIFSKTKLGPEFNKIKQLLIENRYPADVLQSCINQTVVNFAAEKPIGPEKCPVYLKLPWIGNILRSPVWFTTLELCYHLLKEIALLLLTKVVLFMN